MFMELVLELIQKYEALETANTRFAEAVRADKDLPLLLPECGEEPDREAAIKAMTQMWYLEPGESLPLHLTGLLHQRNVAAAVPLKNAKRRRAGRGMDVHLATRAPCAGQFRCRSADKVDDPGHRVSRRLDRFWIVGHGDAEVRDRFDEPVVGIELE